MEINIHLSRLCLSSVVDIQVRSSRFFVIRRYNLSEIKAKLKCFLLSVHKVLLTIHKKTGYCVYFREQQIINDMNEIMEVP